MKSVVIRNIPDEVFASLKKEAKENGFTLEAWLRIKLIEMARKENKMQYSRETGDYRGQLSNGMEVIVDADVWASAMAEAANESQRRDVESPAVWANQVDGQAVRLEDRK